MVKFFHELSEDERACFFSSELYRQIATQYTFLPSAIDYNFAYFGHDYRDFTLIVFRNNLPLIACYIYSKNDTLLYFNAPVSVFHVHAEDSVIHACYKELLVKIKELARVGMMKQINFYANPFLAGYFFSGIEKSLLRHEGVISLRVGEDEIKSNLRKSYKSLVNWGMKNMKIEVIDKHNCQKALFHDFKQFHHHVSQRQTRSDLTWEIQLQMLAAGQAFLVMGYYDNQLVSGSLVLHGTSVASYGVGVYQRTLMSENIPVAHYPLFYSILHAKKIGMEQFSLNEIDQDHSDAKLNNIALFKAGFTHTIESKISYLANLQ